MPIHYRSENSESSATPSETKRGRVRNFFANPGPGLITGAADDDPFGISTYSTAGAAYGLGLLWMAVFSLPPMASCS